MSVHHANLIDENRLNKSQAADRRDRLIQILSQASENQKDDGMQVDEDESSDDDSAAEVFSVSPATSSPIAEFS